MQISPNSPKHTVKWSVIASLILCTIAAAIWVVFQAPAPIVDRMLQADIRKQAKLWQHRVMSHLDDPIATFDQGHLSYSDVLYLSLLPETSDVYRFKLFSPDGTVQWSTRKSDIGTQNSNTYFEDIINYAEDYITLKQVPTTQIDGFELGSNDTRARLHEIVEIYRPIIESGRVIGAIEFYTDITETRAVFITRVQYLLAAICSLGVLATMGLSLLIYRANKSQYVALRRQTDTEKGMLDEQLRLTREVRLLGELNEWLQSSRSLDELFTMVAKFMTHILPNAEGSLYVYSNSRDVVDGCVSWNGGHHKDHIHPESCWGLRRGRTYEFGKSDIEFTCEHTDPNDKRPYFCFPILAHGETVGLLHLRSCPDHVKNFYANRALAQMCSEQISMAIANVRMRDQLQDQSIRDPLTGLFNRRHLTETMRKTINSSERNNAQFAILALDVDHFKKFNDNHGHDAGDMVLRAVGTTLEHNVDGDEVACRPGGEEFTLVLPSCTHEDAMTRAESIRQDIEAIAVRYGEKTLPRITVSIGVSLYPLHGRVPQDLLLTADDALYEAKARGRNQVYMCDHTAPTPTPLEDDPDDDTENKVA